MAKASNAITTERELDERLLELQGRRIARDAKAQRRQLQLDVGVLVFVLVLVISYASLPVLPVSLAEQVSQAIDSSWGFLPIVFVSLALSRVVTYLLTRSYPSV